MPSSVYFSDTLRRIVAIKRDGKRTHPVETGSNGAGRDSLTEVTEPPPVLSPLTRTRHTSWQALPPLSRALAMRRHVSRRDVCKRKPTWARRIIAVRKVRASSNAFQPRSFICSRRPALATLFIHSSTPTSTSSPPSAQIHYRPTHRSATPWSRRRAFPRHTPIDTKIDR